MFARRALRAASGVARRTFSSAAGKGGGAAAARYPSRAERDEMGLPPDPEMLPGVYADPDGPINRGASRPPPQDLNMIKGMTKAEIPWPTERRPDALTQAGGLLDHYYDTLLQEMRDNGTYKTERVITSPQDAAITIRAKDGQPVLNFCANNYLGLSNAPELVAAGKKALDERGFGLSSVRFICGTQDVHKELEQRISAFHGQEDTILYPSCFDANAGLFEALFDKRDAIISDRLNHASIIDGVRLCKARRLRYNHMDMADLEKCLEMTRYDRFRVIATDGVFSMDGHIAPLQAICDLADKHDAIVFVDECHATGFFGATGRGTPEYCGVQGRVDIINSTLGKALGGATGGYTSASRPIVDMLRQKSRPYLFSNTLAPAVAGASLAVFDMLSTSTARRDAVVRNTTRFRSALEKEGFDMGGHPDHPIVPIMLYNAELAVRFADLMLDEGVYVIGFCYPVVPKDEARIRVQISAAHSEADIDKAVAAFVAVRDRLNKEMGGGQS